MLSKGSEWFSAGKRWPDLNPAEIFVPCIYYHSKGRLLWKVSKSRKILLRLYSQLWRSDYRKAAKIMKVVREDNEEATQTRAADQSSGWSYLYFNSDLFLQTNNWINLPFLVTLGVSAPLWMSSSFCIYVTHNNQHGVTACESVT